MDAFGFKEFIFSLIFFKRISDVCDEEYQQALEESGGDDEYASLPEFHRFDIPEPQAAFKWGRLSQHRRGKR